MGKLWELTEGVKLKLSNPPLHNENVSSNRFGASHSYSTVRLRALGELDDLRPLLVHLLFENEKTDGPDKKLAQQKHP